MNTGVFQHYNTLSQLPFSQPSSFLLPSKAHHSFFTIQLPKHKLLHLHVKTPSGSSVIASKTQTKREIFDFEDEFDEDFEEEEEIEDDDEETYVPLRNMKQWTQNKPLGFGEGKVYDTGIEDKLLEEIKESRLAQLANLSNLKNSPEENDSSSKKEKLQKQKASEVVPSGIRVRLVSLPKKKNVHRDLQAAFKGVSGIISISPAVSGNEKTRDPVCKGFGFVYFKSEKDANRFVEMFSGESITFGRIQKQIKCEIIKSRRSNLAPVKPSVPKTVARTDNPPAVLDTGNTLFVEDTDIYKNRDNYHLSAVEEDFNEENVGDISSFALSDDVAQVKVESATVSHSSNKPRKDGEKGKKITAKRKGDKTPKPKLNIPGSANRLKIKEKSMLSDVFSRYSANSALASNGQS